MKHCINISSGLLIHYSVKRIFKNEFKKNAEEVLNL